MRPANWLFTLLHLIASVQQSFTPTSKTLRMHESAIRRRRLSIRHAQVGSTTTNSAVPAGIVADEAGTSKRMIEANYKALATEGEAKQWTGYASCAVGFPGVQDLHK